MRKLVLAGILAALAVVGVVVATAYVAPPDEKAVALPVGERQVAEFEEIQIFIAQRGIVYLKQGQYFVFAANGEVLEATVDTEGSLSITTEWAIILKARKK